MSAERNRQHDAAPRAEIAMSIAALDDAVEALQRDVVDVDDRDAVEILEPRAQRDDLQQVGHDLDVDASRGWCSRCSSSILHVLLGRQRDVEVIDRSRARRSRPPRRACRAAAGRGSRDDRRRRGRRRSRRSDSRARDARGSCRRRGGPSSPEPAIRMRFRPMPGAPAPLEHLAHQLARRERQRDVEDEEDAPRPSCDTS